MEKDDVAGTVREKRYFFQKMKNIDILLVSGLLIEIILLVRFLTWDHLFLLGGLGIIIFSFPKKWLRFHVVGNVCLLLFGSILIILIGELFDHTFLYFVLLFVLLLVVLIVINIYLHLKQKREKNGLMRKSAIKLTPKLIALIILPLISISTTLIYIPQTIQVNISGDNIYQDVVVNYLDSPHYREYGNIDPDDLVNDYISNIGKIPFYDSAIPKNYTLDFEYCNNLTLTMEYVEQYSIDNHLYFNGEENKYASYRGVPDWYNQTQFPSNIEENWSLVLENVILFKYTFREGPSIFNLITINGHYYSIGVITTTGIPISLWSYGYGCN